MVAALIVCLTVGISLLGLRLVRHHDSSLHHESARDASSSLASITATMFALLLAFLVVNLYGSYSSAQASVSAEGAALKALVENVQAFPIPAQHRIDHAVAAYVNEVKGNEFDALRQGDQDPVAEERLDDIYTALHSVTPRNTGESDAYSASSRLLDQISASRQVIISEANSTVPAALWFLLLLLGVTTLVSSWLMRTHDLMIDQVMVILIAIVIGAGLFTTVILQYPFSGSIAVSSAPLSQGALAHLAG